MEILVFVVALVIGVTTFSVAHCVVAALLAVTIAISILANKG